MGSISATHGWTVNSVIALVALIGGIVLLVVGQTATGQILLGIGIGNGGGQAISTVAATKAAATETAAAPPAKP